ncbi:tubulin-tyrosine ligase family protein (macronuclear) [Tetrahymena thermophila SB210]|uniref:Tubulin--tyrosine ligase-like protein 5 n=1 Tax=Tetrahymena thermophila (strain SB210) TaxID=312017 RepID=I7M2Z5_TETTS|nr:tubulin-tyrosine ligase family protein [Tetrahymena thermophila SB210]EAS01764.2 tubulin-tyrosine ligase family protein [Tetrahymena thermophila SB210]|eukprot:XP_001022009.2 tubulin-tyrosine ligase family protein [Tetrahymena thermophila SB210]
MADEFSESVADLLDILNKQDLNKLQQISQKTDQQSNSNLQQDKGSSQAELNNNQLNNITTYNNIYNFNNSKKTIQQQSTNTLPTLPDTQQISSTVKSQNTVDTLISQKSINKENVKTPIQDQDYDILIQFCQTYDKKQKEEKKKAVGNGDGFEIIPKNSNCVRYLHFKPWSGVSNPNPSDNGYYYKFYNGGFVKLIKGLLEENGFKETQNKDWTVMWSCSGIPPPFYQQLMAYQKINHFPKSYEITRKDLLSRNISKMAAKFGNNNFNFCPKTYLIPSEMSLFLEEAEKNKGQWYIVKPSAKSQGQGIFVTDNIQEILKKQNGSMVVCHYIQNPMLINDLKFDLRIYVVVTSINPLKIFIYDDGLARFATSAYNTDKNTRPSRYVHLTNYSVNKYAQNFVPNKDAQDDAQGSKWSLTAFKDYLKINGINYQLIFDRIEDLAVKTILSIENMMNSAFEMHVPYRNNCFELFGFDILIDSNLKPWLLEVNLSPSMNTDSPLDLKIKGNLISDIFTLVGIVPNDQRYLSDVSHSLAQNQILTERQIQTQIQNLNNWSKYKQELSKIERYVIKEAEDEIKRCRRFKRIYPNENSFKYKTYFDVERPLNVLLRNYEMDKFKQNNNIQGNNQIRTNRTNSFTGMSTNTLNTTTTGVKITKNVYTNILSTNQNYAQQKY